jgi:hypothetical protein
MNPTFKVTFKILLIALFCQSSKAALVEAGELSDDDATGVGFDCVVCIGGNGDCTRGYGNMYLDKVSKYNHSMRYFTAKLLNIALRKRP